MFYFVLWKKVGGSRIAEPRGPKIWWGGLGPSGPIGVYAYGQGQNFKAKAVWLSGNTLASMNVVALRQTRLVLGWVTVCGRVNHFGFSVCNQPARSTQPSTLRGTVK